MSTILLSKKQIKVSYEGTEYLVAKPSTRQINDFTKADNKTIEATIAFLETLGLPASVSWEIDAASLTEIIEALMPKNTEKKS
jgi:hypothetical protein